MIATDIFCGAGGASLGLHRAGFDVTGYDYWQPAVDTHNANGIVAHQHDLSDPSLDDRLAPCDLLWASPPCQPFSAAGDGEGEFDDRDGFPWTLRIIGKLRPKVVIVENVKGLTFDKHRDYFGSVLLGLSDLGYEWQWKVLNSADYGVPQTRERCFIIARCDGGRITWPAPTHTQGDSLFLEPWVTMAAALGWGGDSPVPTISPGKTGNGDLWHGFGGAAERLGWPQSRPATTISCDTRVFQPGGHHEPGEQSQNAIRVTVAEAAVLQGFPHDWQFCGSATSQYKQVGNAVPPVMAQRLAEANRPMP